MHVFSLRKFSCRPYPNPFPKIRLAKLITPAGHAPTDVDALLPQRGHDLLAEFHGGMLEHQGKRIIATAFAVEIGPVFRPIQMGEKPPEVFLAEAIVRIKSFEL